MGRKKFREQKLMRVKDIPRGSIFVTGKYSAYIKCVNGIVATHSFVDPSCHFRPYVLLPGGSYITPESEVWVVGYANSVTKGMLQCSEVCSSYGWEAEGKPFESYGVYRPDGGPILMWLGSGYAKDDMSVDMLKWELVPNYQFRERKWFRVGTMLLKTQESKKCLRSN